MERLVLAVESVLAKGPQRKTGIITALRVELTGELGSAEGLVTVLSETGFFPRTSIPTPCILA
jgi:hypothetical protein